MANLADFDTLECLRCGKPTKPTKVNAGGSVRYRCDCGDGIQYRWTINRAGEVVRETQTLSSR